MVNKKPQHHPPNSTIVLYFKKQIKFKSFRKLLRSILKMQVLHYFYTHISKHLALFTYLTLNF